MANGKSGTNRSNSMEKGSRPTNSRKNSTPASPRVRRTTVCAIAQNSEGTSFGTVLSFTVNGYTVTYNGNGATSGSAPLDSGNYTNGNSVTVLANSGGLTRTGYTFAGWNTAANGSGTTYQGGDSFTMGESDVTLYAIWQQIKVTAIVPDPATLYAAIDGEGIHKSTDSGASWTKLAVQPGNLRVKALLFYPTTPGSLYTVTYGSGIWKSSDSGANWISCSGQSANLNVLSLQIDGTGKLYAGTEGGVFVSADGCGSWTAMNGGLP